VKEAAAEEEEEEEEGDDAAASDSSSADNTKHLDALAGAICVDEGGRAAPKR